MFCFKKIGDCLLGLLFVVFIFSNLIVKAHSPERQSILVWDSLVVTFDLRDGFKEPLVVMLNHNNDSDYYYLRLKQDQDQLIIELGQYRNQLDRVVEQLRHKKSLTSGSYSLLLYRAPWVDKEHWRPWKAELLDNISGRTIFKEALENSMPFFGAGHVLLASENNYRGQNIRLFHKRTDLVNKSLKPDLLFADGMLLQRNKTISIWGIAEPNATIKVNLDKSKAKAIADKDGNWLVQLPPMQVDTGLIMSISDGHETIVLNDISIGEIWLASGQSNMEMRAWQSDVSQYAESLKAHPNIRFYVQEQWPSEKPVESTLGSWIKSDDSNIWGVSAVALSFAINLEEQFNIPIGIIQSTWGGTGIQSWMSHKTLRETVQAKDMLERYDLYGNQLNAGKMVNAEWPNSWDIPGQSHAPTYLFNGMLFPFRKFPIAGFLWYQGESNSHRASQYKYLFPAFIKDVRSIWEDRKMPFIAVQLAGYDGRQSGNEWEGAWPYLRDIQRRVLGKDKRALMVSAFDLGDSLDIHPYKKWELGRRMGFAATKVAYNKDNLRYTGPLMEEVEYCNTYAIVTYVKKTINFNDYTGKIEGFEVAGEDRRFYPAKAVIVSKEQLKVEASEVANVKAVRYGWENFPVKSSLKNKNGLAATPFRTDNWPISDLYPY